MTMCDYPTCALQSVYITYQTQLLALIRRACVVSETVTECLAILYLNSEFII